MLERIDQFLIWWFNRNRNPLPTDGQIAGIIDRRLRHDRGSAQGHIIRIKGVNGYDYYITRTDTWRKPHRP
jgi:hypothetical protein